MAAPGSTVEQVKARLPIVEVVSQYAKLQRAGASYKACCPFHSEKTPSFIVSPERGTYHCFGCGVGGDIFTFVQEIEGIDFKGALKILAERAGVPLVYEKSEKKDEADRLFAVMDAAKEWYAQQLTNDHAARGYLHKRGLTDETIVHFSIGWAPDEWRALSTHLKSKGFSDTELLDAGLTKAGDKGNYDRFRSRIMFPLFDTAGRVVAFSGRIFSLEGSPPEDVAKYMNSPETVLFKKSRVLYGYDRAKQAMRKLNFVTLVEGQMDLVMVHQSGWHNTVAVSGTALTPEHVGLMKRMTDNVLLALDADGAGVAAAQKSAAIALRAGMDVKVVRLPKGMDPADLIVQEGKETWGKVVKGAKHIIDFLLDVLSEETKDKRALVRAAEKQVIPFLSLIASPMDRDHFEQRVAERLGVSLESVHASGQRADVPPQRVVGEGVTPPSERAPAAHTPRLLEALGLILWQESVGTQFVREDAMREVAEAMGVEDPFAGVPEHLAEASRFRVESHYQDVRRAREAFDFILRTLERERLQKSYAQAQETLQEAERSDNESAVAEALQLCTELSRRLAKLS